MQTTDWGKTVTKHIPVRSLYLGYMINSYDSIVPQQRRKNSVWGFVAHE